MALTYRIAGLRLTSRPCLAELDSFRSSDARPSDALTPPESRPSLDDLGWRTTAHGLLAGEVVPLGVGVEASGLALRLPGGGEILVLGGGEGVRLVRESTTPEVHEQALLGPGLCLALAMRGVACLHASAAIHGGALCLFLGASGAGKSTLARALDRRPGWRRVADDCLPVVLARRGDADPVRCGDADAVLLARPRFPQLKLDVERQWPEDAPGELPVRRIYRLVESGHQTGSGPESATESRDAHGSVLVAPIGVRQAGLLLVRHTVAARLFPPGLLSWHLSWAARVAKSVPASTLAYPRRLEVLPEVVDAIERDLSVGPAAQTKGLDRL